ncbi:macrolide family glycosyltransferase [Amycolatopsis minnesotensis]|uniref:Glycosyltransferase n=1 Tax=Amycolatopsis minnesotensis TaxID=337894 RepID=A0ABN2QHY8_9PSEU
MAGPQVLFLLYPAFGHTLPMLPIIRETVRSGCRVTATTGSGFEERVRAAGAETTARYTTPLSTSAPPDKLTSDELADRTLRYLHETLGVTPVIEAACPEPPDLVVYDTTLWAPSRVLAAAWRRPSVQVIPTFASNEKFSLGDKLAELAPPIDPEHPSIRQFGEDLAAHAEAHGLPREILGEVMAGKDVLNVVTITREFQMHGDTFDDDHLFVGPEVPGEVGPDAWRPPEGTTRTALISLGTTVNEHPELFKRCAEAFAGTDWHVVLTLGDRITPGELGELPPNVEVHPWVPHGEVLRHASVFVCQGGMGSVQESLAHSTPMVVIPHHPEQQANADRIAELGLGVWLDRATVSADRIRAAVSEVADDDHIDEQAGLMRDHIARAGGAAVAARRIHRLADASRKDPHR